VILYDLITETNHEKLSRETLACIMNWDTDEPINGYTLSELKSLSCTLKEVIDKMKSIDCPGQLYLFEEICSE
jgi:hypothetical protein